MPGPKSEPKARDPKTGRVVTGKTNLARAGLRSGQGMEKFEREAANASED